MNPGSSFDTLTAARVQCLAVFTAIMLLASDPVAGQSEEEEYRSVAKGRWLLGTYFDFSSTKVSKTRVGRLNTESDVLQTGINITGGKMLSDHWGILVIAGINQASTTTPVTIGTNSFVIEESRLDYSIAPAVRYYSLLGDATYFFLQGGFSISRGTSEADEFDGTGLTTLKFKTTGFGVGISPGISYFMTNKLSTEIAIGLIGYAILTGEDDQGNKTEARTFQSLLYLNSVSLGFVYYL